MLRERRLELELRTRRPVQLEERVWMKTRRGQALQARRQPFRPWAAEGRRISNVSLVAERSIA